MNKRPLAGLLGLLLLLLAADAARAEATAFARGFADGPHVRTEFLAANGDTCTHARVGNTVDVPFVGTVGAAPAPGVACTITIASGIAAGSTYSGLGNLVVPKFPPPLPAPPLPFAPAVPVTSASSTSGPIVLPGANALAFADWTSALAPLVNFATQSAFATSFTGAAGQASLAVAESDDPWFLTLPDPGELHLSVNLNDFEVSASSGPGEFAYALIEVIGAFGQGTQPGLDALAEWSFFIEVLGNGQDFVPTRTLIDRSFALDAGDYWIANRLTGLAITRPVAEPPTLALLGLMLCALPMLRAGRQRRGRGAGRAIALNAGGRPAGPR